ncbi:MAG: alpha/beta fold hydrolase [Planctomycetota bacterium]|nr:MAG: alpha/beta fold hydrolase [Planctomycetota bacterium]
MHCEQDSGVFQKTTHLQTSDGLPLFVRRTRPMGYPPGRTLLVIHGAGEHSQRHERWSRRVALDGWEVVALDHRGYGLSGGPHAHIDNFDQYLDDLDRLWPAMELNPARTILFGHSLGGLIAARYAQTRPGQLAGLILSSPLLAMQLRVPAWKRTLGRVCSLIAPRTRFKSTIKSEQLTRDPVAQSTRDADPLRRHFVTASWYFQVLDALVQVWEESTKLTLPTLLLQGDQDEVVSPEAALRWWLTVPSPDKTMRLMAGHLHELMSEPDWETTAGIVSDWLDARCPELHTIPFERPLGVSFTLRRSA